MKKRSARGNAARNRRETNSTNNSSTPEMARVTPVTVARELRKAVLIVLR